MLGSSPRMILFVLLFFNGKARDLSNMDTFKNGEAADVRPKLWAPKSPRRSLIQTNIGNFRGSEIRAFRSQEKPQT